MVISTLFVIVQMHSIGTWQNALDNDTHVSLILAFFTGSSLVRNKMSWLREGSMCAKWIHWKTLLWFVGATMGCHGRWKPWWKASLLKLLKSSLAGNCFWTWAVWICSLCPKHKHFFFSLDARCPHECRKSFIWHPVIHSIIEKT